MGDHILVTWTQQAEKGYGKDTDHITAFNAKTNADYAVDTLRGLREKSSVCNVKVRLYNPVTGATTELEPYLDGFAVKLREVTLAEPKTLMQEQRGE